jgi:hypothetical protein
MGIDHPIPFVDEAGHRAVKRRLGGVICGRVLAERELPPTGTSVSLQREVRPRIWDNKGRRMAVSSVPSITLHVIRSSSLIRPEHRH